MENKERQFWLAIRQALLMAVDAIERLLDYHPRTAEVRRIVKKQISQDALDNLH